MNQKKKLSNPSDFENEQIIPILPESGDAMDLDGVDEMQLPLLPIRNTVLFPGVIIPITVGRQKSIRLVKKSYKGDRTIGVVSQQNPGNEDPSLEELHKIGTVAHILKLLELPDGNTTIIIQGRRKFEISEQVSENPYLVANIRLLHEDDPYTNKQEGIAMMQALREAAIRILRLNPEIPQEAQIALENIQDTVFLTHFLAANINADVKEKQALLEISDGKERATRLLQLMQREIQLLELRQEIQSKVNTDIDQQQRDYYLRQQMKVLQDELGMEGGDQEVESLKAKAKEKKWPQAAQQHFDKEIAKLTRMNPASPEYSIMVNYCELMVELPWDSCTVDNFDLQKAEAILNKDHYGLDKVKERILEYLAVLKLRNDLKGPILCLYGPPGVGKTSLGKSVAKALGRKYIRMSLGGLRDEAEIRGHRKTYIGAMPGRILQSIRKVGTSNPVFVLDEIDKIGNDFRGDPASAFLEVLDPEQNNTFADNYLEVEYDLSKVLFIATANSLDTIHPALRDRMEIIEINGYTLEEKVEIAKKHLIPRQRKEHGLTGKDVQIDAAAIREVIEGYTRESGVRNLERKMAAIMRYTARKVATQLPYSKKVRKEDIQEILGVRDFENETYQDNNVAGLVTGLAWTPVGGEILFIESSVSKGRGRLILSGQLGEVMKESATAALSYLKANAARLSIPYFVFDQYDLHIHVPAGAVPKDGPSAGITMLTSIASVFTQRKVREKLAMTGEITLRGKVLPVGGIKEKLLAARRSGIKHIMMSTRNRKDVEEIDKRYWQDLDLHYVDSVEEVLAFALLPEQVANPVVFEKEEGKKE